MEIKIKNTDIVARKLGPALTRATNDRLKVAREERQKKKEMIEMRKVKAISTKWNRAIGEISLSSEKEDESDTKDNIDPDQANDKYLVKLWEGI